jgi:hypothetical protein
MTLRERIVELSTEGLQPKEILRQLAGEGRATTSGYIFKVRAEAKKKGHIFPERDEEAGYEEELRATVYTPKGKASPRSEAQRYRKYLAKLMQKKQDVEYAASRNPRKVPKYVNETIPRTNPEMWGRFKRMVGRGDLDVAIAEAMTLVPPFEEELKRAIANVQPPPKIHEHVVRALERWMALFLREKRGSRLPRGMAAPVCLNCGAAGEVYRLLGAAASPACWCERCARRLSWSCKVCGSGLEVKLRGDEAGLECVGCGRPYGFDRRVKVNDPKTPEGEKLWSLLTRKTGTGHLAEAWEVVRFCELHPEVFREPDALHTNIIDLVGSLDAERVVSEFFGIKYVDPLSRFEEEGRAARDESAKRFNRLLKLMMLNIL